MNAIRSRTERGAAAVEFALVATMFFTLLFGMIQYSLYFWSTQSAANAARDAARRGAVGQTCSELQNSVNSNVKLSSGNPTVSRKYYAASTTNFVPANEITAPPALSNTANVRIVITYNSLSINFPFIPLPHGGAVTESSVAKVENFSSAGFAAGTFGPC